MSSNYFVKFCFSLLCFIFFQSLEAAPFSKGQPPSDSSWPNLWVQEGGRIRPIETTALKWWYSLQTEQTAQKWSLDHVGTVMQAWQVWLAVYFCEAAEKENLELISLDPLLAYNLGLLPDSLYSYAQIEQAQKQSPLWPDFCEKLLAEAFEKSQKSASRFLNTSKQELQEIDASLTVHLDGKAFKVQQEPSHTFLASLTGSIPKREIQDRAFPHLKAWKRLLQSCSSLGISPSSLRIPVFIDSAKSFRWHEPKEVFASEKTILGFSKQQQNELLKLWKQQPDKAWNLLAQHVRQSQQKLAKTPSRLPSNFQNYLERIYSTTPFVMYIALGYLLSALLALGPWRSFFNILSFTSWALHTLLLLARIVILARPPVASMEETTLYVPWVILSVAIVLQFYFKRSFKSLSALYFTGALLLTTLYLFDATPGLEIIPAVLNSQLWLTIHVLMVVASYAFFLIASVISHTQLPKLWKHQAPKHGSVVIGSMAIGTLLLTSGTLLGAVWAAQSWGRFWDWDPKESWAFISCLLYLLIFHAWAFKKISLSTLHLLSIAGFWIISFTWYGVNFVIATGLHSYGFGVSSYTWLYLFLLGMDALILSLIAFRVFRISTKWNTKP
jgi:ABC-type transport system involved in cytochrome c biogenesis permease subunit